MGSPRNKKKETRTFLVSEWACCFWLAFQRNQRQHRSPFCGESNLKEDEPNLLVATLVRPPMGRSLSRDVRRMGCAGSGLGRLTECTPERNTDTHTHKNKKQKHIRPPLRNQVPWKVEWKETTPRHLKAIKKGFSDLGHCETASHRQALLQDHSFC